MADVNQSEWGRAARGVSITPGLSPDIEFFLLGMRSSAGAAIRRVHTHSPAVAQAYLAGKMSSYLLQGGSVAAFASGLQACLNQYIAWDGTGAPAVALPTKGTPITFAPGDVVRARPDVVLVDGTGQHEARVLLWDDLALQQQPAEMIALPVLEAIEAQYGAGSVSSVKVWQLQAGQQESVAPAAAQAQQGPVQSLLATL